MTRLSRLKVCLKYAAESFDFLFVFLLAKNIDMRSTYNLSLHNTAATYLELPCNHPQHVVLFSDQHHAASFVYSLFSSPTTEILFSVVISQVLENFSVPNLFIFSIDNFFYGTS